MCVCCVCGPSQCLAPPPSRRLAAAPAMAAAGAGLFRV